MRVLGGVMRVLGGVMRVLGDEGFGWSDGVFWVE